MKPMLIDRVVQIADCFERIRSGLTLETSIIKFSVQAENLHECELICLHVKHFTCRVFSFRYVLTLYSRAVLL